MNNSQWALRRRTSRIGSTRTPIESLGVSLNREPQLDHVVEMIGPEDCLTLEVHHTQYHTEVLCRQRTLLLITQ
eukprot:m.47375 g.47375  ORF g.47375 m.47375 type:complete len:74 (-) comp8848_c0_seq2:102-323(-)